MTRIHRLIAPAAALFVAATLAVAPASAAPQPGGFGTIRPGEEVVVDSPIRVNVVMVGYEADSFDAARVIDGLPATSRPIVRSKDMRYGVYDEIGLAHRYEYVPRFTDAAFDDDFFAHLTATGTTRPAGAHTQWYNDQQHNVLDVPSEYLYIDAHSTERWLEEQAAARLGVTASDYTVFLVNWFDRPDFRFHMYQAIGEPDPDTGIDQGEMPWADLISWGGSTGRSWFLDLSAGPEYWQVGFEVDTADITGDGLMDYRLPPVWEYGNTSGYRPFDDLEGDLALAIRYIAMDTLFTSSPLFDPTHYVPAPGGARVFDVNRFEGDPALTGMDLGKADIIRNQFAALSPYFDTKARVTSRPFDDEVRRTMEIFSGVRQEDDCWNEFGRPTAQFHCWFSGRASQFWPDEKATDATVRGVSFTLTDPDSWTLGYPGLALDNGVDGTPSLFVTNTSQSYLPGFGGHTPRILHSGGHMIGFSHGYDGYDSETQERLSPFNDRFFMWLGDGVQSPMSYLFNHSRFGVFNRDNLDRWMVGGLLNRANADTEAILASPSGGSREVRKLLDKADKTFRQSLDAFAKGKWDRAAALAVAAYDDVQRAGVQSGTARVKDSHDRYARKADDRGRGAAPVKASHPCAVPAGAEVDPASMPPGCGRAAAAAPASNATWYCMLSTSDQA
ncbi:MAG: hypothetical protein Q8K63_14345 [Acidimicrobiales bacterium]|nr:hypothetical protein [Acidimicrobiales bacterium]